MHRFLPSFLTPLMLMPGHPQYGPFYLVKGLVNGLVKFPWSHASDVRTKAYIDLLPVLTAFAQPTLPVHLPRLDSNDVVYAGDPHYSADLNDLYEETVKARQQNVIPPSVPTS